jgi:PAS domain S-box-containing protein
MHLLRIDRFMSGLCPRGWKPAWALRRLVHLAAILATLLAWTTPAPAESARPRLLVVGSEQDYPPFAIGVSNGTADGFTVELWRAVAKEQGLNYRIEVRPFNDILQGFKSGKVDVLINLAQSDERRGFADFSVTHVAMGGAVFVRNNEPRIRTEADLAGKSVIVLKGTLAHDYALAHGWKDHVVLVDSAEQALRLLAAGHHDAVLIGKLAGLQTLRNQSIAGVHALATEVGFSQRFAFAVRKGDSELLARINEGLALTKSNGVYDRLYEKWFGLYEVRPNPWGEVWPILVPISGLLGMGWLVLLLRRLQRDRRAAAILRESEERWKFALDGAGDGVWDANLATGTTLYSRRWKQILGFEDNEISTDPTEWSRRIHPDDLDQVMAENRRCVNGETDTFTREFRMRHKAGDWVWVLDRGKVVQRGADDKALRMIGTHTDISPRRHAEKALRDSEERLQRALEASRLALWDLDLKTGDVFISEAWSEMLGGPREPTRTHFDALTAMVPDEDQSKVAAAMGDALRGKTSSYTVEHRVRRPDGTLIWIASKGRVVERGADGRVVRAVGTNRDITERKQAEAARIQLEARLHEAQRLEAIGTLAGGIAHDFNNIMAAILGNVALARQDVGPSHPAEPYLEQISRAGQRARSLVQQILAFSRRQPGELASHKMSPIIEETVALLRPLVGASTKLRTILPERPIRVMGNATQLQQVLMNLGTNAWQALADGVGTVEFGLETMNFAEADSRRPVGLAPGDCAHLWVRDTGCGMTEKTRERIFEPFFTTKLVGQGTGLGLAVVHGIVDNHGGVVAVDTAEGQGSSFHVYLPLAAKPDVEEPQAPVAGPAAMVGHGEHVLYVDDDEVMTLMVHSLLQRLGYRATCTLDAAEAIRQVREDPLAVDLVVTDYNMPTQSGLDLARAMAALRPDLPVVISSGYISDALRVDATQAGVRAVMPKERTFEDLGALIHAILTSANTGSAI